jgi:coronin-1B/1C/6
LDVEFNPFVDSVVASAGEDCKVMIWNVPTEGLKHQEDVPSATLCGHERKVIQLAFHPTASNLLASSSADLSILLWDIEKGACRQKLVGHTAVAPSLAFNYNGNLVAAASKDKALRIFDVRSGQVVQNVACHEGAKGSRVAWLGNSNQLLTTGFSKLNDRQYAIWDLDNLSAPLKLENIDTSSGMLMPYYDSDTKMLYLAGKGDGNIRYFEVTDEDPRVHYLNEFKSTEPQRGITYMPKRFLSVSENEIARAYKVTLSSVEPISFKVPRKVVIC